jgi:hypothetical protein
MSYGVNIREMLCWCLFGSVVAVAFQSVFCTEMYQNDKFFYFLKIIFEISALKRSKTLKKILIKLKS